MKNRTSSRTASLMLVALAMLLGSTSTAAAAEIRWERSLETTVASARATGRPIVVYVATDWCHFCKVMNEGTWTDENVSRLVDQRFTPLTLDGDRDRAIVEQIGVSGYPTTLLYTPDGRYITHKSGHVSAAEIVAWLSTMVQP